jgi:hypothetical protein
MPMYTEDQFQATSNSFKYREAWLHAVADGLREIFASQGATIPDKIRLTCGFPSKGAISAHRQRLGECWSGAASKDGFIEIMISPVLDDPMRVAGVLAHELVHATVGNGHGHRGPFVKLARAIGLDGKMTATTEGNVFKQAVAPILESVGPYPHAELSKKARTKQGTRLLKLQCSTCAYTVRITRKWLDELGPPACPTHGDDLREASSTTSKGSMSTDIGHFIGEILEATDADERDLRRDVLFDYIGIRVMENIINKCRDQYKILRGTPSEILGVDFVEKLRENLEASIAEQLQEILDAPKGTEEYATRQRVLQRAIVILAEQLQARC